MGIASTPDGGGYWIASANGGVFAFGDATFYNSLSGIALAKPIVGIAATPDGNGYWLVASDGGIFAFGDAGFYGSMGGHPLDQAGGGHRLHPRRATATGKWPPTAGSSPSATPPSTAPWAATRSTSRWWASPPTPNGRGYWEVASDGGIFAFGTAPFHGSTGERHVSSSPWWPWSPPPTATATGWWPPTAGSSPSVTPPSTARPAVPPSSRPSSAWRPRTAGYWLAAADGGVFSFGVPFHGSIG